MTGLARSLAAKGLQASRKQRMLIPAFYHAMTTDIIYDLYDVHIVQRLREQKHMFPPYAAQTRYSKGPERVA